MCLSPIILKNKSSPHKPVHSILVPCGKCVECLQSYQNSWTVRLYHEFMSHSKAVFFTLTYDNIHCPTLVDSDGIPYLTVYKHDVQSWLKRLRTRVSIKFKYFITAEYGPQTLRPHYHGILFGVSLNDVESSFSEWNIKFGFVNARDIDYLDSDNLVNSSRYISKYCSKKEMENPLVKLNKVYPVFRLISKGIGSKFIEKNSNYYLATDVSRFDRIDEIAARSSIDINGFSYSLPRYYKQKLYGEKTLLSSRIASYLLHRNDALYLAQFRKIQTENPDYSAFRILDLQARLENSTKYQKLASKQAKFFNNSQL